MGLGFRFDGIVLNDKGSFAIENYTRGGGDGLGDVSNGNGMGVAPRDEKQGRWIMISEEGY